MDNHRVMSAAAMVATASFAVCAAALPAGESQRFPDEESKNREEARTSRRRQKD
jgi:hypothetical protein